MSRDLREELNSLKEIVTSLQLEARQRHVERRRSRLLITLLVSLALMGPAFTATLMNADFGIGVDPPTAKLHVRQTGSADSFLVEDQASDASPFVIDNNGDVGIATTNPAQKLDVQGAAQFGTSNINLVNSTGKIPAISTGYFASVSGANLTNLNANNISSGTVADNRLEGTLDRTNFNASNYVTALGGVHVGGSSDPGTDNLLVDGTTTFDGNLMFNTGTIAYANWGSWGSDNEKFLSFETTNPRRIHLWAPDNAGANFQTITLEGQNFGGHGGYVGINTPDPGYELEVTGNAAKTTGNSWTSISDRRKKKKIKQLKDSLKILMTLRGVSFYWRNPARHGNRRGMQRGFIAQEVEKVIPDWVTTDQHGYKWFNPVGSFAMTLEAMRELKKDNDRLRAQLQQLRQKIDKLAALRANKT